MSADNGIYILKTRSNSGKAEYRVGYATAIDNIYYDFDKIAYYWFHNSDTYNNHKEAVKVSEEIMKRYALCGYYIENDIDYIDFGYIKFPTSGDEYYSDPPEIWEVPFRSSDEE